jgi:hypothetical protein
MQSGPPAAHGVIVHGRQIVMHEGVAMDAFKRARSGKRVFLIDAKQTRRFDEKKRPKPLAAA